ncbi:hypothetical protein NMY22_g9226 [Coprinellus aureogranulatus]|nr:hypothetical protein NMY22_g9226 [Coprinellus aureogranulatus]
MPKRRRTGSISSAACHLETSEQEEKPLVGTTKSTEFWFEDGSIVLQAGNVQLKVYRELLARRSPVFASLFQQPPLPNEATVDGCRVVQLQDAFEDLIHAFRVMYGDSYNSNEVISFEVISALIRFGKKYAVPTLMNEGLKRLKREFPTTLDAFDALDPRSYTHFEFEEGPDYIQASLLIIKLAHECNIQSILPAVYLEVARADLVRRHPKYKCPNNIGLTINGHTQEKLLYQHSNPSIPFDAFKSCIYGREMLSRAWADIVQNITVPDKCPSKECRIAASSLYKQLVKIPPEIGSILYPWPKFVTVWPCVEEASRGLCGQCREEVQRSHDKLRRPIWDTLPSYFKLPDWKELKDPVA